jgi:hypothetical protein
VRIVENSKGLWENGSGWQVESEPALRIGQVEGEAAFQFYRIRAVDLAADGGLIVLDGASSELRRYDVRGHHQWSAGKQGGGPGEFQQPSYVGQQVDGSILIWDRAAARLTVIDAGGEAVATERHVAASGDPPNPYGVFNGGALMATFPRSITPPSAGSILTDTIDVWWYDRVTAERRILATSAGPVWVWTGRYQLPVPFTANPLRAVLGNRLVIASGGLPAVATYDSTGSVTSYYRLPGEATPVGPGDAQRLIEFWTENGYYGAPATAWQEWLDRMPVPDERPAFDRLIVSKDGHVWLRRFVINEDDRPATWDVVTPDGVYLGAVTTPARLELAAVGDGILAGIFRGEDDVEYVHLHAINAPAR